jgi:hypothetical protein
MHHPPGASLPTSAAAPEIGAELAAIRELVLARAEARGKQVLLYAPDGPLGGIFMCSRCSAIARQPDLLDHGSACAYRSAIRSP